MCSFVRRSKTPGGEVFSDRNRTREETRRRRPGVEGKGEPLPLGQIAAFAALRRRSISRPLITPAICQAYKECSGDCERRLWGKGSHLMRTVAFQVIT